MDRGLSVAASCLVLLALLTISLGIEAVCAAENDPVEPAEGGTPLSEASTPAAGGASEVAPADSIPGHSLFPLPFVFYQPETHWGGGVGLLHTYRMSPRTRSSSDGLALVYTERKQFSVGLSAEMFLPGDRGRLGSDLTWSRFPDLFYGTGNRTLESDEEEYTLEHQKISVEARKAFRTSLYLGVAALYHKTRSVERESGGRLAAGGVRGSHGGRTVALGAIASFDDRDRVYHPFRGSYVTLTIRRAGRALGSDFHYTRGELDARRYVSLKPGHVLAGQLLLTAIRGGAPFYDLASLGGANVLRGVYEGRFREANRVVGQAEYRFPVWRRVGGATFAGVGEVSKSPSRLRLDGFHLEFGAGVRFLLSAQDGTRLRIDYGGGKDGTGVYFAFGEPF
ncbi:MAG: BamA/TamA family outer membrane protein [Candidatus Eisenbacteria bacterium]